MQADASMYETLNLTLLALELWHGMGRPLLQAVEIESE
jgi:hypothetical protein